MTLKQWLKRERDPWHCGINARAYLKSRGRAKADLLFHAAINMRTAEIKHLLFRAYENQGVPND